MFRTYQLTLAATPKRLSEAFGLGAAPADQTSAAYKAYEQAFNAADIPFRELTFQLLTAAAAAAYVGENASMTNAIYGFRLDPGDTAPPFKLGPYDSGPLKLSDFWALGGVGEVLVISGITY